MACPVDTKKPAIRVRRDTLVTIEAGSPPPEHQHTPSPVTTTIRSVQATPPPQQRTRPKSFPGLSGSHNLLNDMLRSGSFCRLRLKTDERGTAKDLIDFFRNTSPPPGNYMSTPDTLHQKPEKSHKRFASWPFQRKSKHREKPKGSPRLIKLPDSAVVGRTIGGHRHIAISIPIEYAHLEPVDRRPATPPTELSGKGLGEEQGEDESEPDSLTRRRASSVSPVINGLLAPPWHPRNDAPESPGVRTPPRQSEPPRPPTTDTSVGARSMTATSFPELTALPQGSDSTNVALANTLSSPRRSLRHQATFRSRSANGERIPDTWARRSLGPSLLRRRSSTPESFYTSSSEPIFSDTTTVRIPSLDWGAESSHHSGVMDSDTDDSFHTAELGHSPLTASSQRTRSMEGLTANSSPAFNFSTAYNGSTSGTSSMHDANLPHYAQEEYHPYQPHTLSDITSLGSLLPSEMPETFHTFHITPVMTVVNIQPSPPAQPAQAGGQHTGQAERHPRHTHGFTDVRSAVAYYESLPQGQHPEDPTQAQSQSHEPEPKPEQEQDQEPDQEINLPALTARLDRNEHQLHTLLHLTERLSRRLSSIAAPPQLPPPSSSTTTTTTTGNSSGNSSSSPDLRLSRLRHRLVSSSNRGESYTPSPPPPSPPLVRVESASNSGGGGSGSGESSIFDGGRRGRGAGEGELDGCEVGPGRGRGVSSESGSGRDGGRDSRRALVGGGDVNEQSWLRSDSGSRGCLTSRLGDGEGVMNGPGRGHGYGTLGGTGGLRSSRSRLEGGLRGHWRATFAGRQAAALAWEQRQREVDGNLGLGNEQGVGEDAVEDPAGLDTVETVMRELVLGRATGDESREADAR